MRLGAERVCIKCGSRLIADQERIQAVSQLLPGPVVIKKDDDPTQFDMGYELLLKRAGSNVYTKEGTRVPSSHKGGLVYTR
jgi:hypothetical protein